MEFYFHHSSLKNIAELKQDSFKIDTIEKASDLAANAYYNQIDLLIIYQTDLHTDFFDLKTGFAGEMLQKFSNFRLRLCIVGDFSIYSSSSLRDFIFESNKLKQVSFVKSLNDALLLNF